MATKTTKRSAKTQHRKAETTSAKTGNGAPPHPKWQKGFPGQVVLVLQGGGALGAYQVGVYEAMHEAGVEPDWVIGTSIGAINAALIAGNAPRNRMARLREFWSRVEQGASDDLMRFFTGLPNVAAGFLSCASAGKLKLAKTNSVISAYLSAVRFMWRNPPGLRLGCRCRRFRAANQICHESGAFCKRHFSGSPTI